MNQKKYIHERGVHMLNSLERTRSVLLGGSKSSPSWTFGQMKFEIYRLSTEHIYCMLLVRIHVEWMELNERLLLQRRSLHQRKLK